MSALTDPTGTLGSAHERRFYPRIAPSRPVYVALGSNNLGMLLNLGENGLLVSTPSELNLNSVYRVSLRLDGLAKPIDVNVRTVWTIPLTKRAGIQLLDLSDFDREQIRKWGALELVHQKEAGLERTQESIKPPQETPATSPVAAAPPKPKRPSAPATAAAPPTNVPPIIPPLDDAARFSVPLPQDLEFPRRRSRKRKSRAPALVAWGVAGAAMCLAAVFIFDPALSQQFLGRSIVGSTSNSTSLTPARGLNDPSAKVPADLRPTPALADYPVPKTTPRSPAKSTAGTASSSYAAAAWLKNADTRPVTTKATADRSDATDSDLSRLAANETADTLPGTISSVQAQNQPLASVPTPAAPAVSAPTKSAVTGSIANPDARADNSAAVGPPPSTTAASQTGTLQPWPSRPPAGAARTSFFHSRSDAGAVVRMDPAPSPVTEITPPRGLTSSFVMLPGERVLDSPGITMHVQRAVRVPADRWVVVRTHKKLALGELTSRVDPQISGVGTTSGSITVQATIDKDGIVSELKPLNGSFAFLPGVAKAVREWRYQPTYLDNKPVETQARIEVDFHLATTGASKP
jgi:Gram-negative bacterial TonB protein C-terminal